MLRSVVRPHLAICLCFLSAVSVLAAGPYIDNTDLGTYYPFAVHLPAGPNPPANPPLNLFLHGAGSRGTADMVDILIEYNGPGRRLKEYNAGNFTPSSVLVAEQFITVMPIAPMTNETVPEWNLPGVLAVYNKVKSMYTFDTNRVYCSGYSMGARDMWKFLIANPGLCAAAAISAGEPDNTTDFSSIIDIPIQHYAGTEDFDGSSSVAVANRTQRDILEAGSTKCELVIIPGPSPSPAHNAMANAPFFEPMFDWFLSHNLQNDALPAQPSSSLSPSSPQPSATPAFRAENASATLHASFFFMSLCGLLTGFISALLL